MRTDEDRAELAGGRAPPDASRGRRNGGARRPAHRRAGSGRLVVQLGLILSLAVAGGGVLDHALPAASVVAGLTLLLVRSRVSTRASAWLWWSGIAFLAYVLVTMLPLPQCLLGARAEAHRRAEAAQAVVVRISARSGHELGVTSEANPGSGQAAGAVSASQVTGGVARAATGTKAPLSLNLGGTVRFWLLAAGCWCMFWLSASLPSSGRVLLLASLVGLATVIGALGLTSLHLRPQGKRIWWCIPVEHGAPVGPFVNRNHFAFFCALLAPAALHLLARSLSSGGAAGGGPAWARGPSLRRRGAVALLLGSAFVVLAAAVISSLSRSGLLALLTGTAAVAATWLRSRRLGATAVVFLLTGLLLALALWPTDVVQKRLQTLRDPAATDSGRTRLQSWADSLRLWRRYPLTGVGMEGFRTVFPLYRTSPARKSFVHAENEYVQLLADGGIVGVIIVVSTIACFGWAVRAGRTVRHEVDSAGGNGSLGPRVLRGGPEMAADDGYDDSGEAERWGLGPALAGAAAVVLVNGALDFAWRVPLNGFVVASLMGLAVPGEGPALARGWTCRLATAAVVFAAAGLWLWLYPQARRCDRGSSLIGADASALGQALRWAPTYWLAWYELGRRAATVPDGMAVPVRTDAGHAAIAGPDALSAPGLGVGSRATPAATPRSVLDQRNAEDAAIGFLTSACACNPQDYRLHLALGEYALRAGEYATARSALLRAAELNPDLTPRVRRALSSGDPFTR